MKLFGKKIEAPKPTLIVLPRENGEDIPLYVKAVIDWSSFESICPPPKPVQIVKAGGEIVENDQDPFYLKQLDVYHKRRSAWLMVQALSATPNLEWERVKIDEPDTWELYEEELKETFTQAEFNCIITAILNANSMNEERMREARERFLRTASPQQQ